MCMCSRAQARQFRSLSKWKCPGTMAWTASVVAALVLLPAPARANDPCTPGPTVTCQGDQSGGVVAPGGTTQLNVQNLSAGITPGPGTPGISIDGQGAFNGDGGPFL